MAVGLLNPGQKQRQRNRGRFSQSVLVEAVGDGGAGEMQHDCLSVSAKRPTKRLRTYESRDRRKKKEATANRQSDDE